MCAFIVVQQPFCLLGWTGFICFFSRKPVVQWRMRQELHFLAWVGGCSAKKYPGVMTEEESVFALEQNLFGL